MVIYKTIILKSYINKTAKRTTLIQGRTLKAFIMIFAI